MNLLSRSCNATAPHSAIRAFALAFLLTSAVDAGTYTFTKIADNGNGFVTFSSSGQPTRPAVNNNGTVAFFAQLGSSATYGIYTGNGGPLTVVTDSTSGPAFVTNVDPTINDAGNVVAFSAFMKAGYEAVLTGNGGPLVTIDDDNGPRHMMGENRAIINTNGTVAFTAGRDSGNTNYGAYINSSGVTSLIAEKGTTGTLSADTKFFAMDLNNSGQVAMYTTGTKDSWIYGKIGATVVNDAQPSRGPLDRLRDKRHGATTSNVNHPGRRGRLFHPCCPSTVANFFLLISEKLAQFDMTFDTGASN